MLSQTTHDELFTAFYIHLVLNFIIFISSMAYICYKAACEYKEIYIDLFKILQYATTWIYLVCELLMWVLPIMTGIWPFIIQSYLDRLVLILFYSFETINIWWWANTVMHLDVYIWGPKSKRAMKKLVIENKKNEGYTLMTMSIFIIGNMLMFFISILLFFSENWIHKKKRDYSDLTSLQWTDNWTWAYSLMSMWLIPSFFYGVFQFLGRILIWEMLCYKLKKILLPYYNKVKLSLIATSTLTCLVLILKSVSTLVQFGGHYDINYLMMIRGTNDSKVADPIEITSHTIWMAFGIYEINFISQIFIMVLAIENVNFKWYVIRLLEGRELQDFILKSTCFIKERTFRTITIEESKSERLNSDWHERAQMVSHF